MFDQFQVSGKPTLFARPPDGELARISGKTSRIGHLYDLASDAAVTILLFIAIGVGVGVGAPQGLPLPVPPALLGLAAGCAISLIFDLRMRIEDLVVVREGGREVLNGLDKALTVIV